MEEESSGGIQWLWSLFRYYVKTSWLKYKKLPFAGKVSGPKELCPSSCRVNIELYNFLSM